MAVASPGDAASAPNAAGLLLGHFVGSGIVTQEMLNISKKSAPCVVNFSRLQHITNMQAEINEVIMLNFILSTSSTGKNLNWFQQQFSCT